MDAGHDALHTARLADGNRTADQELVRIADEQGRVVVSKDRDILTLSPEVGEK